MIGTNLLFKINYSIILLLCCFGMVNAQVKTYPAPSGQTLSADYIVEVNGKPVSVYAVITQHHDRKYAMAYFDFNGTVTVKIKTQRPLNNLVILPARYNIKPTIKNGEVTFTLDKPLDISIEPTSQDSPLLLFSNPLETDVPKKNDRNVIYFGPGVHNPKDGLIKLTTGQTLYLAKEGQW